MKLTLLWVLRILLNVFKIFKGEKYISNAYNKHLLSLRNLCQLTKVIL